jgi:RNA polymerase sigma factor (TIGR02999 family)
MSIGPDATAALFTSLYADLCRLARREVRRYAAHDLLGTRTLVHETWIDINARPRLEFDQPGPFLAYAARTMRGLVIDRLRARHAIKRGGGLVFTSLEDFGADEAPAPADLEAMSEALDGLAQVDPALAQVVDLKFFCGFTIPEVATMQGVSERTVQRQWERARLLLRDALA